MNMKNKNLCNKVVIQKGITILSTFFIALLLISFVSAECADFGTYRQSSSINLVQTCTACQGVNASIVYPDGTQTGSFAFQNINNVYNYTFTNTIQLGIYNVIGLDAWCYSFEITPSGNSFDNSQSILFLGLLALFVLFLVGGIYGLANALNGAWQIAYVCLAYLSLFCIFFVSWLYATNYLGATPILASIFWILWLVLAFGFFPFILVLGTYIIGKGIKDNLFKKYKAEGYSDEEAHDMAKQKRR